MSTVSELNGDLTAEYDALKWTGSSIPPKAQSAGRRIGGRILSGLKTVRESTERAVFTIGDMLQRIVQTATSDDAEVRIALQRAVGNSRGASSDGEPPIVEQLREQSATVSAFVNDARQFFTEQQGFTQAASRACDNINRSATLVTELMVRSRILSLNMQIEANRLGQHGAAFNVIAEEMKRFASEVRNANEAIKSALGELLISVPMIEQHTSEMDGRMTEFAHQIDGQLSAVERRTEALGECMRTALDSAEAKSAKILGFTQTTLSALQFQDPTAQCLRRLEHDVTKLQSLLTTGDCHDISLAEIEEDVGEDGSQERSSGEVELF